jgi:hypothetical protein
MNGALFSATEWRFIVGRHYLARIRRVVSQNNIMNTIINGFYVLVSRAFGKYSAAHLVTFFQNVIDMVTGNPAFPGITPTTADAQTALDDLKAKDMAAMNRGRLEMLARNASRLAFLVIGRQWANYVEANCGGSLETLESSGFEARRAPTPPVAPNVPGNLRADYGKNSGEMVLRCKGNRNNRNYSTQYAEQPDGPWIDVPLSTGTRITITALTPGKMYWFRVRANAFKGSSDWTPPTCKMAI